VTGSSSHLLLSVFGTPSLSERYGASVVQLHSALGSLCTQNCGITDGGGGIETHIKGVWCEVFSVENRN